MENVVIIGLGGAGYMAGTYASRYNLKPLLIGQIDGGTILESPFVENFPGFEPSQGYEIMQKMKKQAESFGARIFYDTVKSVLPIDNENLSKGYRVETSLNGNIEAKSIILSLGTEKYLLGVKGEKEFTGRGVSYCATCDGFFFKGKTVAVAGGGDSAMIESNYLADICEKVYIIHRRNQFRCEPVWCDRAKARPNVEMITPAIINEIGGEGKVEWLDLSIGKDGETYKDSKEKEEKRIEIDGLFVAIGTKPNGISGLDGLLEKDEQNYIKVNDRLETNLAGVFAAGDVSTGNAKFKQLVIAAAEGALAAEGVYKYINKGSQFQV